MKTLAPVARVAAAISELASRADAPPFLTGVMDLLRPLIGFDAGYIASTNGDVATAGLAVMGHEDQVLRATLPHLLADVSAAEVASYTGRARTGTEIWTTRRRSELALFNQLYLPATTKHLLVRVDWSSERLTGFTFERRGISRNFSNRAAEVLDVLAPTIALADRMLHTSVSRARLLQSSYDLTDREAQLAELVIRGFRNSEISQLLRISPHTVRNALHTIFRKTDVSNRTELSFAADCPAAFKAAAKDERSTALRVFLRRVVEATRPDCAAASPRRSAV